MAFLAGNASVRPGEPEGTGRMVELQHIPPGARVVARLATGDGAAGLYRQHPVLELALMRIFVTARAGDVGEAELPGAWEAAWLRVVTLRAGHRDVSSGQRETSLHMLCQGENGGLEPLHRMALLAPVHVRRPGKLGVVVIPVTISALPGLDSVERGLTGRRVALRTSHGLVAPVQRVTRRLVRRHGESSWFPSIHHVARGALAVVRTAGKLPAMKVGPVAVGTPGVRHGFFEIARGVALAAGESGVFTEQRELRFKVVKLRSQPNGFPALVRVARLARGAEGLTVRVLVAGGVTGRKRQACELCVGLGVANLRMALLAGDFLMGAGDLEFRLGVVEARSRLPLGEGVALEAVR
jgi:hypothetical protein